MPEIDQAAANLLPVIVLYKLQLSSSQTFRTIVASMHELDASRRPPLVLIYDNTPVPADPGPLPEHWRYEAPGRNAGLAAAYNRALDIAEQQGASWLLLLDQDTALPPNFLEVLWSQLKQWESNSSIVALVPVVRSGNVVVSPKKVGFLGLKPAAKMPFGPPDAEIMAINSGTAVRCDFVRSIGGFSRAYWLDFLDHWLFRQIFSHGKKTVIFDAVLEHNLSVQDYRRNIDLVRYRSILAGESAFITSHKPKTQIPFYLFRLAARSVRMVMQGQPDLALFTAKTMVRIGLHPLRSLEENPQ